jgi:hypothetical protein
MNVLYNNQTPNEPILNIENAFEEPGTALLPDIDNILSEMTG